MRTAWVFSPVGSNFVKTMLRLALDREEISVVADQKGNPTHAGEIAQGVDAILRRIESGQGINWGLYHFVCSGEASWFDFASELFRVSAELGGPTARVVPIGSQDYKTAAKRPLNSRLNTTRFRQAFGYQPAPWQGWLRDCVGHLVSASAPT
jgi:dTDP-4-dehydrorhamnose reductase